MRLTARNEKEKLVGQSGWVRTDRLMRWLHLYTGLFLVPWMAVYATSAFCLNHAQWFTPWLGTSSWESVGEGRYVGDEPVPLSPAERAEAILREIDLEGPHRLLGQPTNDAMVIYRSRASGDFRVTWNRGDSRVVVERLGPPSFYRALHFLHFIRGYDFPHFATIAWAVTVDGAAISTWIWIVSGIYLWARRPKHRAWGGICLVAGAIVFAVLVAMLCR